MHSPNYSPEQKKRWRILFQKFKLLTDYNKYDIIYLLLLIPFVELHTRFDAALVKVKASLGKEYAMTNNNPDVFADGEIEGFNKGRLFFSYSPNLIP